MAIGGLRTDHPVYVLTGQHPEGVSSAFRKEGPTGQHPEAISSTIRKYGITDALLTPVDIESLYIHLGPTGYLKLASLEHVYVTSMLIKGFHYQRFSKLLGPKAKIARGMGITEYSGLVFGRPWPDTHTK